MPLRLTAALLTVLPLVATAADNKKIEPVKASNEYVEVRGMAVVGKDAVHQALGIDPGAEIIAVEVEVTPRGDSAVTISRDDFVLISRKDGQRSPALHPSQIAGSGAIVVSSTGHSAGGGMIGQRRPIWGGIPGTGTRPRQIGADNDVASVQQAEAKSQVADDPSLAENPVLLGLKQKEVPQTKTQDPVKGYLYYILEGKHKLKDLELMYKTPQGNLMLDFQK